MSYCKKIITFVRFLVCCLRHTAAAYIGTYYAYCPAMRRYYTAKQWNNKLITK